MSKFKVIAHVFAGILLGIAGFLTTPAGIALIHQYPAIAPIATAVAVAAVYFTPKTGN